ncbi:hypothetical protein GCM10020331_064330 [Ectobacillus funiculus]
MTLTNSNFNEQEHIDMAMKVGQSAIRVMELLDKAHTDRFGIPEPVKKLHKTRLKEKAIVVTGHNLFALEELLKTNRR